MVIWYEREAYYQKDNPDLRITFDHQVQARKENLQVEASTLGRAILPGDVWIMEVKTLGAMPLWLVGAFQELAVRPGSFSKYGTAYTRQAHALFQAERNPLPWNSSKPFSALRA